MRYKATYFSAIASLKPTVLRTVLFMLLHVAIAARASDPLTEHAHSSKILVMGGGTNIKGSMSAAFSKRLQKGEKRFCPR